MNTVCSHRVFPPHWSPLLLCLGVAAGKESSVLRAH